MHGQLTPEDIKRAKLAKNAAAVPSKKELADHIKRESEQHRIDKETIADRAKAAGMKKRQFRDADGKIQEVWMFSASYYAMGFNALQIAAAERLEADWQAAYRSLRGQGYEASVDHARSQHGPHLAMVDAQTRLQQCKFKLGARSWEIVVAVIIHGATARELHARGAKDHVTVKDHMTVAFNDLDAFYTGSQHKDRTWSAIEAFNAERAAMIAAAEQGVG